MRIEVDNIENEVNEISRDILNELGNVAHESAIEHIKNTYNTRVASGSFKIKRATKDDLTYKIDVSGRSVNLIKKVTSVTPRGASVMVKKGPSKFIRSAFIAPWQKGQSKKWLFVREGKLRRALYTIGIVGMYKSKACMKVLNNSINRTLRKFNTN